jgi:hypothetical protein
MNQMDNMHYHGSTVDKPNSTNLSKFVNDLLQLLNSQEVTKVYEGLTKFINRLVQECRVAAKIFEENLGEHSILYKRHDDKIYCARNYFPAYGALDINTSLIQYILHSPQLVELRNIYQQIDKVSIYELYNCNNICQNNS